MKNFSFEKDGKTYWYSRAIVCVSAVFCKDDFGKLYVLANQRGTATDKEVGKWNMPVGYLDFNETCSECAAREIVEETGVKVEPKQLTLYNINSTPDSGTQDVGFRYYAVLPGTIDEYKIDTSLQEKNEVVRAKWILTEELDKYLWAWNHRSLIDMFIKIISAK
jgi:ADP-ribose pyrophosphatase YjhB (NUDIX family)